MKYRIILGRSDNSPFIVQRLNEKFIIKYWRSLESFASRHNAEDFIRRRVEIRAQHTIGDVLYEYTESDLIVDKLKMASVYQQDRGAENCAVSQQSI